jgi:hypothetical protein
MGRPYQAWVAPDSPKQCHWGPAMLRRLEQVTALVVAAGLAIVSYWLFFSWAQGGSSPRVVPAPPAQQAPAPR